MGETLKEGIRVLRENLVLGVPGLIAYAISVAISALVIVSSAFLSFGVMMFLIPVLGCLPFLAVGVTMGMANEALDTGRTSLQSGRQVASAYLWRLIIVSLVFSVVVGYGAAVVMLFIVSGGAPHGGEPPWSILGLFLSPAFVALFFLMYSFPAVVARELGAFQAVWTSIKLVFRHFLKSLSIFSVLGITYIIMMIFSIIPIIGLAVGIAMNSLFVGFSSIVIMKTFMTLQTKVPLNPIKEAD